MKESVETVLKELVTIPTSTSTIHLKDSAVAIVWNSVLTSMVVVSLSLNATLHPLEWLDHPVVLTMWSFNKMEVSQEVLLLILTTDFISDMKQQQY